MRSRGKLGGQHKVPRMDSSGALTGGLLSFLRDGGPDAKTAVGLYGGVILVTAISFTALFFALTRSEVVDDLPPPAVLRRARLRFGLGVAVYSVAFALSWVSPALALAAHATMALYYLSEQASRLPSVAT